MRGRERPVGADAAALERLRAHRVRPERGRGVGEELERLVKSVRKLSAQAERASGAWAAAAPDGVAANCRVTDLRAGTLSVACRSAADRHAADRWLRAGGLDDLRAIAKAPVSKVRFTLASGTWEGGDAGSR